MTRQFQSRKSQSSNTRIAPSLKREIRRAGLVAGVSGKTPWDLEFGISLELGVWDLELGHSGCALEIKTVRQSRPVSLSRS